MRLFVRLVVFLLPGGAPVVCVVWSTERRIFLEAEKLRKAEEKRLREKRDLEAAFAAVADKRATLKQVQMVDRQRKLEEAAMSDSSSGEE